MVEQDSKTTRTNFAAFNQKTFNHQNAGKLRDFYRIGKMLGSGKRSDYLLGAFGEVRMCVHRETGA